MRKLYSDLLWRKLLEGRLAALLGGGTRLAGTWLSRTLGRPRIGPTLGTLILTYRCNYFCEFCELPRRAVRRKREGGREFDREEMLRLVRGFRLLRTPAIGITGGEPFIRDDLFDVLAEIRRLGMVGHVNTNGHFLRPDAVRRLVATGVESVNVSLDAPDAETHNRVRGNRRSFDTVLAGIEEVLRQRRGGRPRVGITTVLAASTVDRAPGMARLAREVGVDSLGFIPVHEYRDGLDPGRMLPERDFAERVADAVARAREAGGDILENSPGYLSLFARCFSGRKSGLRCYAPWNSLVVDCYGRVFPCVPFSEIDDPIAVVGPDGLPGCWRSDAYRRKREALRACQDCYWNCHTEMNLLFQRARPGESGGA